MASATDVDVLASEVRTASIAGEEDAQKEKHFDLTAQTGPSSQAGDVLPEMYFIVHNVSKKHNVGTLARCATAFGVKTVVLIGSKNYNTFGCQGASNHVDFTYYETLKDARQQLTEVHGCEIVGVEIVDDAVPIEDHPFMGNTAFIMGNEGTGMTPQQKAICDKFVYIRQYGPGTASLNVSVAASIVMHHFGLWAQYAERGREGEKYLVAERRDRTQRRWVLGSETPEEIRQRRQREAEEAAADNDEEASAHLCGADWEDAQWGEQEEAL